MRYRSLGRTGFMVSEVGVGGEWHERVGTKETLDLLARCGEHGINILDCYMPGPDVRANIGKALAGQRDKWFIEGHLGTVWENNQYQRTRDLRKAKESYVDLLRQLHTDYIDIGMIHYIDELEDWQRVQDGGLLSYALDLKKQGVVRSLGFSSHNAKMAKIIIETGLMDVMLFSINPAFELVSSSHSVLDLVYGEGEGVNHALLANVSPERSSLFRLCEDRGVGITVMKPFAGGLLLDAERSPFGVALTPAQCLHYALSRPAVSSVMVGFENIEHVEAAVAYEKATAEELDYASVLRNAPTHSYVGQCTYCGHCAPCAADIDVAMVNKYLDLARAHEEVPATVREHYLSLDKNGADCLQCGACMDRCPFGVDIIGRMAEAEALFR